MVQYSALETLVPAPRFWLRSSWSCSYRYIRCIFTWSSGGHHKLGIFYFLLSRAFMSHHKVTKPPREWNKNSCFTFLLWKSLLEFYFAAISVVHIFSLWLSCCHFTSHLKQWCLWSNLSYRQLPCWEHKSCWKLWIDKEKHLWFHVCICFLLDIVFFPSSFLSPCFHWTLTPTFTYTKSINMGLELPNSQE